MADNPHPHDKPPAQPAPPTPAPEPPPAKVEAAPSKPSPVRPSKPRKFEAPPELPEKFGVYRNDECYVSGFVKTEHVRELLDAFGLEKRSEIVFPFQHLQRERGEIWSMRVEPVSGHTIDNQPVYAHAWVFMQQYPERSTGA